LLADGRAALVAIGGAESSEEEPQVVVDFGERGNGAARIGGARTLVDGDGRLQALDQIDVWSLHLMQKLPGVG